MKKTFGKRMAAWLLSIVMLFGAYAVIPVTVSADVDFTGVVGTPDYIEDETDQYETMYEFTVPADSQNNVFYQARDVILELDEQYQYDLKVKEYCVTGASSDRGLYFLYRNGDTMERIDNTNYLQGKVMKAGDSAEQTIQGVRGTELSRVCLEMKIVNFEANSTLRVGVTPEITGCRVTASGGVELVDISDGDYVAINDTVTYSYNDNLYVSGEITEPVDIHPGNIAEVGTITGKAVKITADEGITLINVPENGQTMEGAKIRYTYNGETYVTEPVTGSTHITAASGTKETESEYQKFLFVHFTGADKTADSEQIYFSVSEDGINWEHLNDGQPVLRSSLGEQGVRDPHIVRSPDGKKFYIVATDLSIYHHHDWSWAQYEASKKMMIWESDNLLDWSEQREYEIGADIDASSVGCVWAPESIWDEEKQAYMVFWASMTKMQSEEKTAKQRIFRSYTTDFKTFSKPEVYIERENHVIDTTILEQDGLYYRFSKNETTKKVNCDYSNSLSGTWRSTALGIGNCEGPTALKFNGENKWGLFVDSLGGGWSGYGLFATDNLMGGNDAYAFTETVSSSIIEGTAGLRHGTVIPISNEEYDALRERYPAKAADTGESALSNVKYSFAEDITASAGKVNNGDVKEWKITSTPEFFYIDEANFDALDAITIHSGHGGSEYTGTYKFYAYDNGGEPVTADQLNGFKTDAAALGTELAKVTDSNDKWGYNTITINQSEVTQDKGDGNYTLDTENSSPLTIPDGTGKKALIMQVEYSNTSPTAYFDFITLSYDADRIPPKRWDSYGDSFHGKESDNAIVWNKYSNNSAGGTWNKNEDGIVTISSNAGVTAGDVCYGVTAVIKNIQPDTKYYITFKKKADISEVANSSHGFYLKPDTMSTTTGNTDVKSIVNAVETRNNSNISIHSSEHTDDDWEQKTFVWTSGTGIKTEGDDAYAAKFEFTLRSALGSVQIKDLIIFEEPEPGKLIVKSVTGEGIKEHSVIVDSVMSSITIPVCPGTDISKINPVIETDEGVTAELTAGTWEDGTLTLGQDGYTEEWRVETVVRANPLFDGYYADPNIVVFGDTYYVYPTTDGGTDWNSTNFKCFSSKDLVHWKDEGVILELSDVPWSTGVYGWAPTIAEKDGKYYFYFSAASKTSSAKQLGVAVADSPVGPFVAADTPMIPSDNGYTSGGQMIDPHVFIDEDGQAYIYWGNQQMYAAKLNPDMMSVNWDSFVKITPSNYTEGTFVIKRNGTYYFMWSKNDTGSWDYQVRYGVSDSPLGPISGDTKILSRTNTNDSKIRGTGHHSVLNIPGTDDWYICYHRFNIPLYGDVAGQLAEAGNHREVCLDRMEFDESGNIKEGMATMEGITAPVISIIENKPGDMNKDGQISAVDALLALKAAMSGPTEEQTAIGDIDKNSRLDVDDVLWILQAASGEKP